MANQDILLFVFFFVALMAGVQLERWRARWARRRWLARQNISGSTWANPRKQPFDAAEQLRTVMVSEFEKRPLMSKAEARVFYAARDIVAEEKLPWLVMAQVSLGEVLSSQDERAHAAINSKRVDILIVSNCGIPLIAVEYQGEGHYQGTAAARDAVKKEALRRAGVRYAEVTPEHDPKHVMRQIVRLAKAELAPAESSEA